MKLFRAAACVAALSCCMTLHAGFLPTAHLEPRTLQVYDGYLEKFEREYVKPFTDSGKLWIDARCCVNSTRSILEARMNEDVPGGSIHHFSGFMHVPGGSIEDMRRIMEDYPAYPKNFRPDVTKATAELQPDSVKGDDHYISHLTLSESTLWMNVEYDTSYDTHYRLIDPHHWISKSVAFNVKELKDAKDPSKGAYPEDDGHGFVWRTQTYWFVRETPGGIDLQVDSITLSRPNISGFAWFGNKRAHDAVDKMLHDARTALAAMQKNPNP